MDSYQYLSNQDFNLELEPVCALDPLLLIPRIEYITPIFNLAKSKKIKYSLVVLDLKNFHLINDIYSYNIGDIVIHKFLKLIRSFFPNRAFSLRYRHGDEFLFFIPQSRLETIKLFERIKVNCEKYNFFNNLDIESIQVSFRYAVINVNSNDNYKILLEKAEQELRKVKKKGTQRHD